jgi:hypothetical protein
MKELVRQYRKTKELAEKELYGDPRTMSGREMAQRQARAELPELYNKVTTAFKKVGFTVFVDGPATETFIKNAKELADVIVVDYNKATETVKSNVVSAMGHRNQEFSPSAFSIMMREVRELGSKINLTSIPNVEYDGPEFVGSPEAIGALVDRYFMKYLGADFVANVIEYEAAQQAITLDSDNVVIPVLVLNVTQDLREGATRFLFGGRSINVSTTSEKDTTPEFVTNVFKAVKKARSK